MRIDEARISPQRLLESLNGAEPSAAQSAAIRKYDAAKKKADDFAAENDKLNNEILQEIVLPPLTALEAELFAAGVLGLNGETENLVRQLAEQLPAVAEAGRCGV